MGQPDGLLELLDARGVAGKQLHVAGFGVSGDGLTLVISRENLHDEDRVRRDLADRFGSGAQLVDGLAAVSAVGAGINATYATVRRGSAALAAAGVMASGLSTSSFRVTWLVPRPSVEAAVRALHREFLEQSAPVPLT
jgi:aspartate kinase